MKRGDLVCVHHYSDAGYYLIKGQGTTTDKFKRKYFIHRLSLACIALPRT